MKAGTNGPGWGGGGCAISDYKLHVTHLDVGMRRNPGPLEEKKHTLCHTQTEVYELLPDSLCVLVLVSVRACACVTTAVRPSGHLLSKATPEAQGVLRFLFLCAICAGNKVWGQGWGGVGSGGYALGKKKKLVTLTEAPLCKLTTPPVKSSIFNMLYISKK